jgi:hypothetical protein
MISIMAGQEIMVLELYQISLALTARRHPALHWNAPISILPVSKLLISILE